MFTDVFDKINKYDYNPLDEQIKDVLQKTWQAIAFDYIYATLQDRRPNESIDGGDICRTEVQADEVRSAVYSNIHLMETRYPSVVEAWMDLSVEEQDRLLTEVFPNDRVYGV